MSDLTLKHIGQSDRIMLRLNALLTREQLRPLTDDEMSELIGLQNELYCLRGLDTPRFRKNWEFKAENELDYRHDIAQVLAVHDRLVTLQTYRRRFDALINSSLETLRLESFNALLRSQSHKNKLADLRGDCADPDAGPAEPDDLSDLFHDEEKMAELSDPKPHRPPEIPAGIRVHKHVKLSGKDDSERDAFSQRLAEPKVAIGPSSADDVDCVFAALFEEAPWMREPIEHMWTGARANAIAGQPFGFDPILLHGGPGTGKSHIAQSLASLIGCPTVRLDGGTLTASFDVGGVEKAWRSAGPGVCVRAIHDYSVVNPLVIFDEIDKCIKGSAGGDPQLALLPMLQADTAERYRCPYVQNVVDISYVNWIACANDIVKISRPLLDRFTIFEIKPPTGEILMQFIERKFSKYDVSRAKMLEIKKAVEKGTMSLRGISKLEERLRAYDMRPLYN